MSTRLHPARQGHAAVKLGLVLVALAVTARLAGMPAVLGGLMLAVAAVLVFIGIAPRLARSGWNAAGRQVDSWWARRYDGRAERRLRRLREPASDGDRTGVPGGDIQRPAPVTPAAAPAPRVCVACGNPEYGPRKGGGNWGPLVTYSEPLYGDGYPEKPRLIHKAHFEDESTGFYGRPYEPAPAPETPGGVPLPGNPETEGNTMTAPRFVSGAVSRITPDRRAQRAAGRSAQALPAAWAQVVAQVADAEAGTDAELLDFMDEQVMGVAAYAEALVDFYEAHVNGKGLDPRSLAAVHDVADAVAHAAEMMAGARAKFGEHYELPREYAGNGGVMPHDGRFFSGE